MPFYSTPVEIETALAVEEVSRRLSAAVTNPYNPLEFLRSRLEYPVAGRVGPNRCWLEYRTFYNNGFKRFLYLNFVPTEKGTLLRGQFAPSIFVKVFSAIWCLLASLSLLTGFVEFGRTGRRESLDLFSPLGMLLGYFALFNFGIWLSSFSEAEVTAFVEGLLDEPEGVAANRDEVVIRPRKRF